MMKLNVALNANVCKSVKVSFYFTIVYKTSAGIQCTSGIWNPNQVAIATYLSQDIEKVQKCELQDVAIFF